ncbi:MAG: GNAT family N-acetyltransferase [Chloroflexi bacterium]|nr:GNAT family N-acetyltransferase [Chloroflexota bacterium]
MTIDIRGLAKGEFRAWYRVVESAFADEPNEAALTANERIFEMPRVLVAADGERMVGGAGAFTFRLTVPGGEVAAAGVTAVGVLPTHRRLGTLTALMRRQLKDVQAAGEPVAVLWASEGSIYQRFGYGLASLSSSLEIDQARASFRTPQPPAGTLRMVEEAEAARTFPAIYDAVRAVTPGFIDRPGDWWEAEVLPDPEYRRRGAGPRFLVLHEVDGSPEGYLDYRVKSDWDEVGSKSSLLVRELMPATTRSSRELWRFCFGHDLIATVKGGIQPPDHPLLLMLDEPRRLRLMAGDGLWLRILDVPAALKGRSYRTADSLTFELRDGFLPEQAGRWTLDTTGDAVSVARTEAVAEMTLDTTDLAAMYLAGFSATDLVRAGRCEGSSEAGIRKADALFAWDRRPWCPFIF